MTRFIYFQFTKSNLACDLLIIQFKVILYCSDPSATRFRLLKHTRLNVVAFLNELPKTQHDIASFNVDVNTYTVSEFLPY